MKNMVNMVFNACPSLRREWEQEKSEYFEKERQAHLKSFIDHRYLDGGWEECDEVDSVCSIDVRLAERIARAYRSASGNLGVVGDGQWRDLNHRKLDVHDALLAQDSNPLAVLLANPVSTDLFWGFDYTTRSVRELPSEGVPYYTASSLYSQMIRLGEAWGAVRLEWPEAYWYFYHRPERIDPRVIVDGLERLFQFELDFPNPYEGERGFRLTGKNSENSVVSFRAIQSLHQALTIWEKLGRKNGRVLEIGAGLGRTAYYARKFGITDYTIIDLPITGVAQAHYLATVLGDDAVTLYSEPEQAGGGGIHILPPSSFLEHDLGRFDLILNADSLTEMDFSTMRGYWERIKTHASAFLSVNHEFNKHTMRDLMYDDPAVKQYARNEYWLRRGYVEEYVVF